MNSGKPHLISPIFGTICPSILRICRIDGFCKFIGSFYFLFHSNNSCSLLSFPSSIMQFSLSHIDSKGNLTHQFYLISLRSLCRLPPYPLENPSCLPLIKGRKIKNIPFGSKIKTVHRAVYIKAWPCLFDRIFIRNSYCLKFQTAGK